MTQTNDVKETRLKRLYFRSAHRGSKETDLILGPYAAKHLGQMDEEALGIFEEFLDEHDGDIWDWVAGNTEPDIKKYEALVAHLRSYYDLSR